jgi:hypothetical protein
MMTMNPETNRFEMLLAATPLENLETPVRLYRPNGEQVPDHWTKFSVGEHVVIKGYTFAVAYIGETAILFEPVGPVLVGAGVNEASAPGVVK